MTLSDKRMFEQNLELTRQRLIRELESPGEFDWIPQNAKIVNLPKDDPQLLQANLDLSIKLAGERGVLPIVLLPEPGFEMPWQSLASFVSGKQIVNIKAIQGDVGLEFSFDDGSELMFVATRQPDRQGSEQLTISVGMLQEAAA